MESFHLYCLILLPTSSVQAQLPRYTLKLQFDSFASAWTMFSYSRLVIYGYLLIAALLPTPPPLLSRQLNILFICKSSHYLSLAKKNASPESGMIHDPWRVIKRRLYIDNELLSQGKTAFEYFMGQTFTSLVKTKKNSLLFSRNFQSRSVNYFIIIYAPSVEPFAQ